MGEFTKEKEYIVANSIISEYVTALLVTTKMLIVERFRTNSKDYTKLGFGVKELNPRKEELFTHLMEIYLQGNDENDVELVNIIPLVLDADVDVNKELFSMQNIIEDLLRKDFIIE